MKLKSLQALLALTLLAGCSSAASTTSSKNTQQAQTQTQNQTLQTTKTTTDTSEEVKDDEIDFEGVKVSGNQIDLSQFDKPFIIDSAGTYDVTGSGSMLIVDAKKQDVTLNFKDVTLTNSSLPPVYIKKAASVTVNLEGNNTITMGSRPQYESLDAAFYSKADVIFTGDGTLNIDSGYEHGLKAKDTAVFQSGTYNITAQNDGIHVNETAEFQNGTYNIQVNGEGMEAKDDMTIQNGTYNIRAYDDGINAINSLVINGGTITSISQNNDGIDSNGDLIINGGTITAIGASGPETSFDTDNTPFEINGGKILGIAATGNAPTSTKQPVILVGASGSITSVEVKEGSTTVVAYDVPSYSTSSSTLFISDSNLKAGSTVTIYANGQQLGELTLQSGTNTLGNVQTGPGGAFGGGMMPGGMGGRR